MKRTLKYYFSHIFILIVCLSICLYFGWILYTYAVPMKASSYDLSIGWEGEAMPANWKYDQKGWSVFVREGEKSTPLSADGQGGFTGLKEPGQTFYFSRLLTEDLDNPTLRLDVANRSIAVFLDGELVYTDCPQLDNRIGYLTLPMLEADRTEPLIISLPLDYKGKELTIAQSTDLGDKQTPDPLFTVWPCPVTLYCGYAYESNLISESFQIAIPAAFCFEAGLLILIAFLWQLLSGKKNWKLPFLALTAFLWSIYQISSSSFSYRYFDVLPVDIAILSRLFSVTLLLLFFTDRFTGVLRFFFSLLTAAHGICILFYAIGTIENLSGDLWQILAEGIGLFGLILVIGNMAWNWKKGNFFAHSFGLMMIAGGIISVIWTISDPALQKEMLQQLLLHSQGYFLWKLMNIVLPSAMLSSLLELFRNEITFRTDAKLLSQQYRLARSGFDNMCRHQEEVQMLRHDMAKHLLFLRQNTSEESTARYLDELLGQLQNISPVVQSRNHSMDIILNAKLSEAKEKGVAVHIDQMDVPEKLPLSDTELCALMMNLLDNAIAAASLSDNPGLSLDFHQKEHFFVLVCKNTVKNQARKNNAKKQTALQHGLGLKIIRQIILRYGDLMEVEEASDTYCVTIALPLDQLRK